MLSFAESVLNSELGKTHLFSVGQAGFIIKSSSGHLLAIDLYLSECVERIEGNIGFKRLLPKILSPFDLEFDAVICTHPHLDHFDVDSIPQMLYNKNTKLFCSVDCDKLTKQLNLEYYNDQITYVRPGDKLHIEGFEILFVNCDHGESASDAVGVLVKVDGKLIYETGDTCLRLDIIDEISQNIDVLIAPINGAYGNMNEEQCADLADALKPKVTIPCHYGMFASHHGDIGKFYEIMKLKNRTILMMQQGEKYTL